MSSKFYLSTLFVVTLTVNAQPTTFTRQQIKQDIDYWYKTLRRNHPNLYHAVSKKRLLFLMDSTVKALPDKITPIEATFAMSPLVASLNEGHLGLLVSKELMASAGQIPFKALPISLRGITDQSFLVKQHLTNAPQLSYGDSLFRINGQPASYLIRRYRNLFGGLINWRDYQIMNFLNGFLYFDGVIEPFQIEATHEGQRVQLTLAGISKDSLKRYRSPADTSLYYYRIIDNRWAYFDFRRMEGDMSAYDKFLQTMFIDIQDKKLGGLIVDLRYNGGGNSVMGDKLFQYFNTKRYRMAGGSVYRLSRIGKHHLYKHGGLSPFKKLLVHLMPRSTRLRFKDQLQYSDRLEPFFTRPVCFLIGRGTFSSANMIANAVKDFQLATLIGETTAEPANDYGNLNDFTLPNTRFMARTPITTFIRANGDAHDFDGIKPDIEVISIGQDVLSGHDPVLERAKQWLLSRSHTTKSE